MLPSPTMKINTFGTFALMLIISHSSAQALELDHLKGYYSADRDSSLTQNDPEQDPAPQNESRYQKFLDALDALDIPAEKYPSAIEIPAKLTSLLDIQKNLKFIDPQGGLARYLKFESVDNFQFALFKSLKVTIGQNRIHLYRDFYSPSIDPTLEEYSAELKPLAEASEDSPVLLNRLKKIAIQTQDEKNTKP